MSIALSANRPATRLATQLSFLVAGFGIACWAPLVPLAKQRLGIDDAALGLLLLCIGAGSVTAMVATGPLSNRYGSKPVIMGSGILLALVLPALSAAATPVTLGALLLIFGGALGSLDVAMNIHAIEVERAADRPLMSGFHGLFSVGGVAGSGAMTLCLSAGIAALPATLLCSGLMLAAMMIAGPRLLDSTRAEEGPAFVMPHGIVLLLAVLAMTTFLAEGAMLDWSALLVTQQGLAAPAQAGLGFIMFASAMTIGRLLGDAVVARLGDKRTLLGGGDWPSRAL
jgi:MFS family permease